MESVANIFAWRFSIADCKTIKGAATEGSPGPSAAPLVGASKVPLLVFQSEGKLDGKLLGDVDGAD